MLYMVVHRASTSGQCDAGVTRLQLVILCIVQKGGYRLVTAHTPGVFIAWLHYDIMPLALSDVLPSYLGTKSTGLH